MTKGKWPAWSGDGRWIYFALAGIEGDDIWKISSTGGEATQVTRNGGDVPRLSRDGKYLFYQKGWPTDVTVWRLPVEGGEETQLLDSVHASGQWTVAEDGIYFFKEPDEKDNSDLCFYDFESGKIETVTTITRRVWRPIAVSPDGRQLFWSQVDDEGSDLMLVENFR